MKGKSKKPSPHNTPEPSQRAQRFEIKVPIRYRVRNQETWREGHTENISQSGLLFRAPEPLSEDTVIELTFALPATLEGETGATCRRALKNVLF